MLNYLWAGMIIIGVIFGAFNGKMPDITNAALDSAKEAVTLCITMMGVMSFWVGIMEIATQAGVIEMSAKKLRPVIRFLFPNIPPEHKANEYITTNFIANILGLGWAATPAGLKAMEELAKLEEKRRGGERREGEKRGEESGGEKRGKEEKYGRLSTGSMCSGGRVRFRRRCASPGVPRGTASNEMCTFLILNISSLQLIPVNVIAYRSQYGSVNPTSIVGPGIVATMVGTLVAVVFCKVMERR